MPTRLLPPGYQVIDANGRPVSGAQLYTYEAGTSTPKLTYSDAGLTSPNTNPIVADSAGRFAAIFSEVGDYRLVCQTATGASIFTADPVEGADPVASTAGSSFRNVLINGDFSQNQRVETSVGDDAYCLDRWYVLTSTGNVGVEQQALQAPGITTNLRLTQPDASPKRMGVAQIVEMQNCRQLRTADVVLSARVRASSATPIRYAILSWTGSGNNVTSDVVNDWTSASYTAGGFFNATTLTVQAVGSITPSAATWTSITPISSVLSAALQNLIVFFWTQDEVVQNTTFDLALTQTERGTAPSAFEYIPASVELFRCQRYYEKTFSANTKPAQATEPATATRITQAVGATTFQNGNPIYLATPKRGTMTITTYNPSSANAEVRNITVSADCSNTSTVAAGSDRFSLVTQTASGSSAGNSMLIHYTVESEL